MGCEEQPTEQFCDLPGREEARIGVDPLVTVILIVLLDDISELNLPVVDAYGLQPHSQRVHRHSFCIMQSTYENYILILIQSNDITYRCVVPPIYR